MPAYIKVIQQHNELNISLFFNKPNAVKFDQKLQLILNKHLWKHNSKTELL